MDRKDNAIYGYKLQNAFPKSLGIVTLDDADENTLSEFTVNFGFSEFIPIKNNNVESIITEFGNIVNDVKSVFNY